MTQKSGKTAAGRQVEMIVSQLDSLSTLPRTAAVLLSCLSEQTPDFEVLAGIIQSDPALTAKVLSIAAGQGLGDSDNSINLDWVVAQLPAKVLRDAVLSVGVFDVFGVDPQTNQRRRVTIFKGGMAEFKADLMTWSNNYSVTVQTILSGPTVWVKIVAKDDGED